MSRPLLLGHRGARAEKAVRENTLPSFDLALLHGCDGFEFDVRQSVDGQAVVCHDATVGDLQIAGSPAQRVALPLLSEVLIRYQNKAFLDIEVKVSGLEQVVTKLLRDHTPARGYVVSSFLPDVLRNLHNSGCSIPLGLICETRAQLTLWPALPIEYVIPNRVLLERGLIANVKAAGKKVLVWTVNNPEEMRKFAAQGVAGIISDQTERLVLTLGQRE